MKYVEILTSLIDFLKFNGFRVLIFYFSKLKQMYIFKFLTKCSYSFFSKTFFGHLLHVQSLPKQWKGNVHALEQLTAQKERQVYKRQVQVLCLQDTHTNQCSRGSERESRASSGDNRVCGYKMFNMYTLASQSKQGFILEFVYIQCT